MVGYWKFICTKRTEAECFQRKLFGDVKERLGEVEMVKKGDTLFLYNVETDALFGPFVAESDGKLNIEPDAWEGGFPAQVRVDWGYITIIENASRTFGFLKEKRLRLRDFEGKQVFEKLRIKVLPRSLREEIQKLDGEIHSIAHRIEEIKMARMHPADREVELEKLKGQFFSKMKDFVWAVRKLDRATGILDLPSNR